MDHAIGTDLAVPPGGGIGSTGGVAKEKKAAEEDPLVSIGSLKSPALVKPTFADIVGDGKHPTGSPSGGEEVVDGSDNEFILRMPWSVKGGVTGTQTDAAASGTIFSPNEKVRVADSVGFIEEEYVEGSDDSLYGDLPSSIDGILNLSNEKKGVAPVPKPNHSTKPVSVASGKAVVASQCHAGGWASAKKCNRILNPSNKKNDVAPSPKPNSSTAPKVLASSQSHAGRQRQAKRSNGRNTGRRDMRGYNNNPRHAIEARQKGTTHTSASRYGSYPHPSSTFYGPRYTTTATTATRPIYYDGMIYYPAYAVASSSYGYGHYKDIDYSGYQSYHQQQEHTTSNAGSSAMNPNARAFKPQKK
mmetsp:Transcript_18942/g.38070  ORF Transcript_18942/g.38070 Transcript_18942/m.38070 type:complete len:359 (-) Transcript_18942:101-1177(-)